uniref:Uncharacterized protein n=1 Tax=Anguilla anguilla TaxID=7936 RepID=A0A0E9V471_ANGAN
MTNTYRPARVTNKHTHTIQQSKPPQQ